MLLCGLLVFLPETARAVTAIVICLANVAMLNMYQAPKNRIVFWVAQISLFSTVLQYLAAVLVVAQMTKGEQEESIGSTTGAVSERNETIGVLLIIINIVVVLASLVSCVAILFNLSRNVKRLRVPQTSVKPERNASSTRLFVRCHQSLLHEKNKNGLAHELQSNA
jgi:hypothetical protein